MTPRDPANLPVPRRAVGVAYVPVNVASRTLDVAVGEGLHVIRPRQTLNAPIQVRNVPGGERVRVAIAAVDEGILGLTNYKSPNPVDYFFGRRALGVMVRDDYGRLLNPNLGAPSVARQGGDGLGGEGLTVHTTDCSVGRRLRERDGERWMGVDWAEVLTRPFETAVGVLVRNGKGALAQVAQAISAAEADITHIDMGDEPAAESTELHLLVSVRDRLHLADVLRTLKRAPVVLRAARVKP